MLLAPYWPMSTRCLVRLMVGSSWNSSITTSGAPLPALSAVCSLVYSSPPAPAFVQSIWMFLWVELNRSTTGWNSGYQAHTLIRVTAPAAAESALPVAGPEEELPPEQAASVRARPTVRV